jgi:putative membrane protein
VDETPPAPSGVQRPDDPAQGRAPAGDEPWWEQGTDPDYRFSLANERTFLAWVRTSLAFLAGAVALEQLVPAFRIPGLRTAVSVLLAVAGLVAGVGAYRHWARNERAMRHGHALPHSPLMLWISAGLGVVAVVVVVALVVQAA